MRVALVPALLLDRSTPLVVHSDDLQETVEQAPCASCCARPEVRSIDLGLSWPSAAPNLSSILVAFNRSQTVLALRFQKVASERD